MSLQDLQGKQLSDDMISKLTNIMANDPYDIKKDRRNGRLILVALGSIIPIFGAYPIIQLVSGLIITVLSVLVTLSMYQMFTMLRKGDVRNQLFVQFLYKKSTILRIFGNNYPGNYLDKGIIFILVFLLGYAGLVWISAALIILEMLQHLLAWQISIKLTDAYRQIDTQGISFINTKVL